MDEYQYFYEERLVQNTGKLHMPIQTIQNKCIPETYDKLMSSRNVVISFRPDPLTHEQISQLLDVTKYAPSSRNQRQIQYAVLQRPVLDQLSRAVGECVAHILPSLFVQQSTMWSEDAVFRDAPHAVAAIVPRSMERPGVDDGIIALATFDVVARGMGVATHWCRLLKYALQINPSMVELLGLPPDLCVAGVVAFGWPLSVLQNAPASGPTIEFVDWLTRSPHPPWL